MKKIYTYFELANNENIDVTKIKSVFVEHPSFYKLFFILNPEIIRSDNIWDFGITEGYKTMIEIQDHVVVSSSKFAKYSDQVFVLDIRQSTIEYDRLGFPTFRLSQSDSTTGPIFQEFHMSSFITEMRSYLEPDKIFDRPSSDNEYNMNNMMLNCIKFSTECRNAPFFKKYERSFIKYYIRRNTNVDTFFN